MSYSQVRAYLFSGLKRPKYYQHAPLIDTATRQNAPTNTRNIEQPPVVSVLWSNLVRISPMSVKRPTVFITSATGTTGFALCRILLAPPFNYPIRSTTRDPDSPAAQSLSSLGVQFVGTNNNERPASISWSSAHEETLLSALKPCAKLFLCLLPNLADLSEAPRQAALFVRLAKQAGISQVLVMTSLGVFMLENEATNRVKYPHSPSDLFRAHLQAQSEIENLLVSAGFDSWSVIRPGFFMANFLEPKISKLHGGYSEIRDCRRWTTCLTEDSKLGLVDHVDIARLVAAAFEDPVAFGGKKLGVVSDVLGVQGVLDTLARSIRDGRVLRADFIEDSDDYVAGCEGRNGNKGPSGEWKGGRVRSGFFTTEKCLRYMMDGVDLEEARRLLAASELIGNGGMTTFTAFLKREKKMVAETYCVGELK